MPAPAGMDWQDIADPVFHPVARDLDLPNVLIPEAMAEDSEGFLWLGEETGLLRWDGYQLRSYQYDPKQPGGLQDDFIQALHQDTRGRLWAGTVSGGLARYDPDRDRVVSVPLGSPGRTSYHVWTIADDGDDGLWVATSSGLFHVDAEGRTIGHLTHVDGQAGGLPDALVSAVLRDHRGTLWVGTRGGLVRRASGDTAFAGVALPVRGGMQPLVTHLFEDEEHRIWAGTRQHGAFEIDPATASATSIGATEADGADQPAPEITGITEAATDTIWLGTFGRGIVEVGGNPAHTRLIRRDPLIPGSLDSDTIRSLYRDRSGIVWVGTNEGLSQYHPETGFLTLFGAPGRPKGLTDPDISAILALPDGTIWAGSEGHGLEILAASGERRWDPSLGRVFSMATTAGGSVLIATSGGLFLADPAGRPIAKLAIPGRAPTAGLFTVRIFDGAIWAGGIDDGLWELALAPDHTVTVRRHFNTAGLISGNVRAIALRPDGTLAVGTDEGLDLLNRTTGRIEHIVPNPADPHALSGWHIMCLETDRLGRLWAGTDNAGIAILDGRDRSGRPQFRSIGVADGLPNGDIDMMLSDRQGHIWASTDNGLAMIDPADLSVRAYRRADGVAISAYWNGAGSVAPGGDLMFGGLGGITVIQPDKVAAWNYRPRVVITGVRIGGRSIAIDRVAGAGMADLQVPPEAKSFAVEFSALDFSAPSLNRYGYMLEGYDADWVQTDSTHRVAEYTNLPPGDYTLRLRGSNRSGEWAELQPPLHIRVQPAWFQTMWFRGTEALAALLLVLLVVQGRTVFLRRRQHELERQVAERTEELSASQRQLHQFAFFDALTALPNRRAFNDRFRSKFDKAGAGPQEFALMFVDLDEFKEVNDTFGHDAGDALLVVAAGRMRAALREDDFAARLGGDEFAVILEGLIDSAEVDLICERLVSALCEPARIAGTLVKTGASVGVAVFPRDASTAEELLRRVDAALYEAKRAGRGVWRRAVEPHQDAGSDGSANGTQART